MSSDRLIWVVPEKKGGIRTYTEGLWPAVAGAASRKGISVGEPLYDPIENLEDISRSVEALLRFQPTLIHLQHEYGLFGSKIPGFYLFPKWLAAVRKALPHALIFATAHNVLDVNYRLPLQGKGWQIPLRWLANQLIITRWQKEWNQGTWGSLDGVFIHSKYQKAAVQESGCPWVKTIPHFVPKFSEHSLVRSGPTAQKHKKETPKVLVFGFITPDKGQDVAIRAISCIVSPVQLILAGGGRRPIDRKFIQECERLITELKLQDRVTITGFVDPAEVDSYYQKADLVLAPFRETSGSGSLVQALGRGAPVLASDLPLNLEIAEREKGCLEFFKAEDPYSCGLKIQRLLENGEQRELLSQAATRYAQAFEPEKVAEDYVNGYGRTG
jgi:glycosyltransferase involved in cell wall biosynthesis